MKSPIVPESPSDKENRLDVLPVLQTKLQPPAPPKPFLPRNALLKKLEKSWHRRLTVVTGAMALGKTCLLAQWAEKQQAPVAWVTLATPDNAQEAFFSILTASLYKIIPALIDSPMHQAPLGNAPTGSNNWEQALNTIWAYRQPVALVIDGFDEIRDGATIQAFEKMLPLLPSNLHILVSSRNEHPFNWVNLQLQGELLTITPEQLAFSSQETEAFIKQWVAQATLKWKPDELPILAKAIQKITSGWIGAVLLLLRSGVMGEKNLSGECVFYENWKLPPSLRDGFLQQLLQEQELEAYVPVLEYASLLAHFDQNLLANLLPDQSAEGLLKLLEKASWIFVRKGEENEYHDLAPFFKRLLLEKLHEKWGKEKIRQAHKKIAVIWEGAKVADQAYLNELKAMDHAAAAHLLSGLIPDLLNKEQFSRAWQLASAFPEHELMQYPEVCTAQAWLALLTEQEDLAEMRLAQLHQLFDQGAEGVSGEGLTLLRYMKERLYDQLMYHKTMPAIEKQKLSAIEQAGISQVVTRLAFRYFARGQLLDAQRKFKMLAGQFSCAWNIKCFFSCLFQGFLHIEKGEMEKAKSMFSSCFFTIQTRKKKGLPLSPFLGISYVGRGIFHYEQNDLEEAYQLFNEGIQLSMQIPQAELRYFGYAYLVRMRSTFESPANLLRFIKRIELQAVYKDGRPVQLHPIFYLSKVKSLIALGQIQEAMDWWAYFEPKLLPVASWRFRYGMTIKYELLMATAHYAETEAFLSELLDLPEIEGCPLAHVQFLLMLSRLYHQKQEINRFRRALSQALVLAASHGYSRTFIDEGSYLLPWLQEFAANAPDPMSAAFTRELVKGFGRESQQIKAIKKQRSVALGFGDLPTQKEAEVLTCMQEGMTNAQIARRLHVSHNTVKTHIQHLYSKMGVKTRSEALKKAAEFMV